MGKMILMEEFHVTVFVPVSLSSAACASIRRNLNSKRFQSRLRNAIREMFRQYPVLKPAKFSISR